MAIAKHLSPKFFIHLSHYREEFLKSLEISRTYKGPFKFELTSNIQINYDLDNRSDLYIVSVPVQHIRSVLQEKQIPVGSNVLILSKGIESKSLMFPSQIIEDIYGKDALNIGVLTGPSHAEQIVEGSPASLVISSVSSQFSKDVQKIFSNDSFRVYSNKDVIGVQLGGAVKNVISIASGIAWGLGFKENTVAAILTRGIYEIKKLGKEVGASKDTLNGLAGLGDLMATSFSLDSRNRYVGEQIAKGRDVGSIIDEMKMKAEGVETSKSLHFLSQKLGIDMPICDKVYNIVHKKEDPGEAISQLMSRELRSEF